jgi:hypothetical protein
LLDRQDQGTPLNAAERKEAEGLVELAEMLSLLRLRASRAPPLWREDAALRRKQFGSELPLVSAAIHDSCANV